MSVIVSSWMSLFSTMNESALRRHESGSRLKRRLRRLRYMVALSCMTSTGA